MAVRHEHERALLEGRILPAMRFSEKVWALTVRIPAGRVTTYAELARALGGRTFRGYRAVGMAMNRNPYAPRVPCHRVLGSDGRLTGYAQGLAMKRHLLMHEGVTITDDRVNLAEFLFHFNGGDHGADRGPLSVRRRSG